MQNIYELTGFDVDGTVVVVVVVVFVVFVLFVFFFFKQKTAYEM